MLKRVLAMVCFFMIPVFSVYCADKKIENNDDRSRVKVGADIEQELQYFHKRFEFIRDDDGTLKYVKDVFIKNKVNIKDYINFIKGIIVNEQKSFLSNRHEEDFQILEGSFKLKGFDNIFRKSIQNVRNLDITKIFGTMKFKQFIKKSQNKLNKLFVKDKLQIIAAPTDPSYFRGEKIRMQVVKELITLARRIFDNVIGLNTVIHMVNEIIKLVDDRRTYNQNMLLYYLDFYSATQLNLTSKEINFIVSSIYEWRIPLFNIFEYEKAKLDWEGYGFKQFFKNVREGNQRLRVVEEKYDWIAPEKLNYSFQEAVYKADKVILNLFTGKNFFSRDPSISYIYESPKRVYSQRIFFKTLDLGMDLIVGIPSFIKSFFKSYLASFYGQQMIDEGALKAYFESKGLLKLRDNIHKQSLNPFDQYHMDYL